MTSPPHPQPSLYAWQECKLARSSVFINSVTNTRVFLIVVVLFPMSPTLTLFVAPAPSVAPSIFAPHPRPLACASLNSTLVPVFLNRPCPVCRSTDHKIVYSLRILNAPNSQGLPSTPGKENRTLLVCSARAPRPCAFVAPPPSLPCSSAAAPAAVRRTSPPLHPTTCAPLRILRFYWFPG